MPTPPSASLATEVGILYDGELVAEGPPKELTERLETGADSTLEDVFLDVTTEDTYEDGDSAPMAE